ncbi:MAG: glycosyltransferase family 4 protein [Gemmatimonadota bacterium]|nr:glycosyltransferase family 4 protein [Gemmatimonadota bacterium]
MHIVARNRAWSPAVEQLPEGTVHRMPPWRRIGRRMDTLLGFPAFFSPRWIAHIGSVIRRVRAELLIVRDMPLAPTAISAARRAGIPIFLDMAEHYPAMMQQLFDAGRARPIDYVVRNPKAVQAVDRYVIPRVDRILIVVEEMGERLLAAGIPANRLVLVSNTPPRARAERPSMSHADGDRVPEVVHLGNLEVPRGLGVLIEAAAMLRHTPQRVRLKIIGDGRDGTLFRDQARTLGLSEQDVEFTGRVPSHEDALAMVARADIGAIPQHVNTQTENIITNKLFDYMAAGLPVVTSDARPSARIVRETMCGEIFHDRDARDLAGALVRLSGADERHRAGEAGRHAVLDRYNWEQDTGRLLEAIADFGA